MSRELDAAGITEPALRASYARCRQLNAAHGRTYFLATRLLPPGQRPAIHALYGLARYADEIVDDLADTRPWPQRLAELDALAKQLLDGLAQGRSAHPVLAAPVHTAVRYQIDPQHFADFMVSMQMDRPVEQGGVAGYQTFDDLARYVHGSAAVIGLQVLPVLGTVVPRQRAEPHAAALGVAFQITNFLRDADGFTSPLTTWRPSGWTGSYWGGAAAPGGPIRECAARWPTWSPGPGRSTAGRRREFRCWPRYPGPA
jgi:phytoene synthase